MSFLHSITETFEKLNVQTLGDRHKTSRCNLLLRLLFSEENHGLLLDLYKELMTTKTGISIMRAAERGDPPIIYAKSAVYHNGFLPKNCQGIQS